MSADQEADEFIDKMMQQGIVAMGMDFASRSDDESFMTFKIVGGQVICERITEEEFYASAEPIEPLPVPDTVVAMQQLMEKAKRQFDDIIGIDKIMLQPQRKGKSVYAEMQKMLIDRYAEPQIYIKPRQHTHPTSPRKRLK